MTSILNPGISATTAFFFEGVLPIEAFRILFLP
jgi:hypothetical protein